MTENITLIFTLFSVCLAFMAYGYSISKGNISENSYLVSDRNVNSLSLTFSLTASCFGIWILIGPAEASTWGGVGAITGYAAGQSFVFLYYSKIGEKVRRFAPKARSLTEVILKRYDTRVFKLVLILTLLYLYVYFCAEVTAIAKISNLILGIELWKTAALVIISTLIYALRGGLKISILTDKIQFIIISIILFILLINLSSFDQLNYLDTKTLAKSEKINFNFGGVAAGLTFFIAVFATNLFDQGIWQRIFAAKDTKNLKRGFVQTFLIVFPVILLLGFVGIYAGLSGKVSDPSTIIFSLILEQKYFLFKLIILVLALTLVMSSLDTLTAGISSLYIIHEKQINFTGDRKLFFRILITLSALIAFYVSSKGLSILYLFLLADLLCCAAAIPVFYGFYNKAISSSKVYIAIVLGIICGLALFPSNDFSKSILVGGLVDKGLFPSIVSSYLLFWSFVVALLSPVIVLLKK